MIEIKNLTKKFHADHDALCNISHRSDTRPLVIVGDQGSGKTVLLEILSGLDNEYDGEVLINEVERKGLSNKDIKISYITKIPTLFERKSVFFNLEYVFKVSGEKHEKNTIMQKIKEVAEELEIFDILSMRVKKLNIYQKRLVCLARAWLKQSKIIVVDEPFFRLLNFEKSSLWQSILLVTRKLSSDLIVAEKSENLAYFVGCNILKLEYGTKIEQNA